MGAAESKVESEAAVDGPALLPELSETVKMRILHRADAFLQKGPSDDAVLDEMLNFDLNEVSGYLSPEGKPKLLSVSICHRHGSRGPGDSELKPWGDANAAVRKQWVDKELETLTQNGNYMIRSLGKWFAEKYLMSSADDYNDRPKNKKLNCYPETKLPFEQLAGEMKQVWRSSSSGRAKLSGEDFCTSMSKTYNHPLQLRPVRRLMPEEPDRYLDVEGEDRKDDHGVDHYFRPWNVHKKQANDIKKNASCSLLWITKAAEHALFLTALYTELGSDKSLLKDPTKMLWCTTYVLSLYDCERFYSTSREVVETLGTRVAVRQVVDTGGYYEQLEHLACWTWSQRFVYHPYVTQMGARITFDILQQALHFDSSAINVFSAHDYTIMGVLACLQVSQRDGGLQKAIEFGAYLTFELWTKPPEPHHSEAEERERTTFSTSYSNGVHNKYGDGHGPNDDEYSYAGASDGHAVLPSEILGAKQKNKKKKDEKQKELPPGDHRIMRIILNDAPFNNHEQKVMQKMQKKNRNARELKDQEKFMYVWPVREERERCVLQLNMTELRVLLAHLRKAIQVGIGVEPALYSGQSFKDFVRTRL